VLSRVSFGETYGGWFFSVEKREVVAASSLLRWPRAMRLVALLTCVLVGGGWVAVRLTSDEFVQLGIVAGLALAVAGPLAIRRWSRSRRLSAHDASTTSSERKVALPKEEPLALLLCLAGPGIALVAVGSLTEHVIPSFVWLGVGPGIGLVLMEVLRARRAGWRSPP
jgi:hypothetical protein